MGEHDPNQSSASASGLRILRPCDIVAIDEALLQAGRDAEVSLVIEDGRLIRIRTLPVGTVDETTEAESTAAPEVAAPGHRPSTLSSPSAGKRRDRAGKRKSKKL